MRGDNIEYVPSWVWDKDASTYTAADPLTVDDGPWPDEADEQRGTSVGLAMLLLAFALGLAIGWWLK